MKNKNVFLILIFVAVCCVVGLDLFERNSELVPEQKTEQAIPSHVSEQRKTHILYGDRTGGGHLYGTGKPCKSEFPPTWNKDKIINEINLIAANDNINWEQQKNGYYVAEQKVGSVKLRVVKDRDAENIITAYPLNTGRNPCPDRRPANDNY